MHPRTIAQWPLLHQPRRHGQQMHQFGVLRDPDNSQLAIDFSRTRRYFSFPSYWNCWLPNNWRNERYYIGISVSVPPISRSGKINSPVCSTLNLSWPLELRMVTGRRCWWVTPISISVRYAQGSQLSYSRRRWTVLAAHGTPAIVFPVGLRVEDKRRLRTTVTAHTGYPLCWWCGRDLLV